MSGNAEPGFPASALFLTVEGIEGSGKSTLVGGLADRLRETGRRVTVTREPGATPAGKVIRDLLLHGEGPLAPETELALFFADRAQNIEEVIRPALRRGEVVIADRFTDSTVAYQGGGRGVPRERVQCVDFAITGGFRPHRTLLLDLPVAAGLARLSGTDRFEGEAEAFHQRVRDEFLRIAREEPDRVVVIPAGGTPDEVFDAAWAAVVPRLGER